MIARAFLIAGLLMLPAVPAMAFDNIEADVFYERNIREVIQKEFYVASLVLKHQAEALKVPPREKDMTDLRRHMYEKALILGRCADRAISMRKRGEKVDTTKFAKDCATAHIKVIDEVRNLTRSDRYRFSACDRKDFTLHENKPYDFLLLEGDGRAMMMFGFLGALDIVKTKECIDSDPMHKMFPGR